MQLRIDWDNPIIDENIIQQIQPADLDDFYVSADAVDRANLFFVLLTSLHHYLDKEQQEKAAHLCFLMAYYLFVPLVPPGSCELALYYIKKALSLNPLAEYAAWLPLMEAGN